MMYRGNLSKSLSIGISALMIASLAVVLLMTAGTAAGSVSTTENDYCIDVYEENTASGATTFLASFDNLKQATENVNVDNWGIDPENRYRIEVDEGTYGPENGPFPITLGFENTILISTGATENTIIKPANPENSEIKVVNIASEGVAFEGFTVATETVARQGVFVDTGASNVTLNDLIVTGIVADPDWSDPQGYAVTINGSDSTLTNSIAKDSDHGFVVGGDDVVLRHLVARGNGHGNGHGYDGYFTGSNIIVEDFTAESTWADGSGYSIAVRGENNILRDITSLSDTWAGIYLAGGKNTLMEDSVIKNKGAYDAFGTGPVEGFGIVLVGSYYTGEAPTNNTIENVTLENNNNGIGFGSTAMEAAWQPLTPSKDKPYDQAYDTTVTNCSILNNDKGIWLVGGTGNEIHYNDIVGNSEFGVLNESDGVITVEDSLIKYNGIGLGSLSSGGFRISDSEILWDNTGIRLTGYSFASIWESEIENNGVGIDLTPMEGIENHGPYLYARYNQIRNSTFDGVKVEDKVFEENITLKLDATDVAEKTVTLTPEDYEYPYDNWTIEYWNFDPEVNGIWLGISKEWNDTRDYESIELGLGESENVSMGGENLKVTLLKFTRASRAGLWMNNIVGNSEYGVEAEEAFHDVWAMPNWWGHPTGPSGVGPGEGDAVTWNVKYVPWLTRPFETVEKERLGYFGIETRVEIGWNTLSTPIALENEDWGDIAPYIDENIAYRFDPSTQKWEQVLSDTELDPLDAIYVKMNNYDKVPLAISPELGAPPVRRLKSGWNFIGLTTQPRYGYWPSMKADRALVSVEETPSGLTGYTIAVSPPVARQDPWTYTVGQEEWIPEMEPFNGYWVYMENPDELAGFSSTPLPWHMSPEKPVKLLEWLGLRKPER